MRLGIILLSALAAMLIVSGCGGGDSTGSTGSAGSGSTAASSTEAGATGKEGPTKNEEAAKGKEAEGEEGEKSSSEKASPEKAALIKEGEAICGRIPQNYQTKLKALEKKNGGKKPSPKEANLKAAVPPLHTAIEEFEELSAPSGEEAVLEEIVAGLETAAEGLEAEPESVLAGPKSPFAEFQKVTGEYGFKLCSQL
jgi:hypothetical protein